MIFFPPGRIKGLRIEGINFKFKHVFSSKLTFRICNIIHKTKGVFASSCILLSGCRLYRVQSCLSQLDMTSGMSLWTLRCHKLLWISGILHVVLKKHYLELWHQKKYTLEDVKFNNLLNPIGPKSSLFPFLKIIMIWHLITWKKRIY